MSGLYLMASIWQSTRTAHIKKTKNKKQKKYSLVYFGSLFYFGEEAPKKRYDYTLPVIVS